MHIDGILYQIKPMKHHRMHNHNAPSSGKCILYQIKPMKHHRMHNHNAPSSGKCIFTGTKLSHFINSIYRCVMTYFSTLFMWGQFLQYMLSILQLVTTILGQ